MLTPLLLAIALAAQSVPPNAIPPIQPTAHHDQDAPKLHYKSATGAVVKPWYKTWQAWTAIGGGLLAVAIIANNTDDGSSETHNHNKTIIITPEDPPCHPPGHCR